MRPNLNIQQQNKNVQKPPLNCAELKAFILMHKTNIDKLKLRIRRELNFDLHKLQEVIKLGEIAASRCLMTTIDRELRIFKVCQTLILCLEMIIQKTANIIRNKSVPIEIKKFFDSFIYASSCYNMEGLLQLTKIFSGIVGQNYIDSIISGAKDKPDLVFQCLKPPKKLSQQQIDLKIHLFCKNRNISTSNLSLDLPPDFLKDNCPPSPLQSCDDFNKMLNDVEEGVMINENKISDNKKNPEEENVINKNKVPEHKENSGKENQNKISDDKKEQGQNQDEQIRNIEQEKKIISEMGYNNDFINKVYLLLNPTSLDNAIVFMEMENNRFKHDFYKNPTKQSENCYICNYPRQSHQGREIQQSFVELLSQTNSFHLLKTIDMNNYSCKLCKEKISEDEKNKNITPCNHMICNTCIFFYLSKKIKSSNTAEINCFAENCKEKLSHEYIIDKIKDNQEIVNKYNSLRTTTGSHNQLKKKGSSNI